MYTPAALLLNADAEAFANAFDGTAGHGANLAAREQASTVSDVGIAPVDEIVQWQLMAQVQLHLQQQLHVAL